jgi:hypothetical protein
MAGEDEKAFVIVRGPNAIALWHVAGTGRID